MKVRRVLKKKLQQLRRIGALAYHHVSEIEPADVTLCRGKPPSLGQFLRSVRTERRSGEVGRLNAALSRKRVYAESASAGKRGERTEGDASNGSFVGPRVVEAHPALQAVVELSGSDFLLAADQLRAEIGIGSPPRIASCHTEYLPPGLDFRIAFRIDTC
jgi:hypothetical protein